jgi:hypothetical protein
VLALTWLAATFVAVFVALQAVGAVGDQVTETSSAAGRRAGPTTPAAPSSSTTAPDAAATSTTVTVPAAPAPNSRGPAIIPTPSNEDSAPPPAPAASSESQPSAEDAPGPEREASAAPAPEPGVTTIYNLQGGSIGVRCTGSTIELVYNSPAPGFTADVNSAGPGEVDVRFENDDHRSRIKVQCSGGGPVVTDEREEPR